MNEILTVVGFVVGGIIGVYLDVLYHLKKDEKALKEAQE